MTADELPEGWAEPPLEKCVRVLDNLRVPVNSEERKKRHGNVPYYGATGQVGWIDDHIFDEELVLVGEDGAPFFDKSKPIAYLISGKTWVNNHAHVLRALPTATTNQFVKFRLDAFNYEGFVNGTTRLKLTKSSLLAIPFPLPPLAEQLRIVAAVERILDKVSAARARLERVPMTLKRFLQAVLAAACSGGMTDALPPNWRAVKLVEVIDGLKYGTSKKSEYETKGVPILRIPNVSGGQISHADMKYSALDPAEYEQLRLRVGDVLMIRSNGSVSLLGKTALVSQAEADFAYAGYLIRIRPNATLILPTYLNALLASEAVRNQIEMPARSTSGVNNINSEEVRALEFALPPLDEQQEIVRRVSALFARADAIQARAAAALKRVESLTQAVLAKAFRGELVPTEAELARRENRPYESAGELLERIRTSATAPAKPSRTRKPKAK